MFNLLIEHRSWHLSETLYDLKKDWITDRWWTCELSRKKAGLTRLTSSIELSSQSDPHGIILVIKTRLSYSHRYWQAEIGLVAYCDKNEISKFGVPALLGQCVRQRPAKAGTPNTNHRCQRSFLKVAVAFWLKNKGAVISYKLNFTFICSDIADT